MTSQAKEWAKWLQHVKLLNRLWFVCAPFCNSYSWINFYHRYIHGILHIDLLTSLYEEYISKHVLLWNCWWLIPVFCLACHNNILALKLIILKSSQNMWDDTSGSEWTCGLLLDSAEGAFLLCWWLAGALVTTVICRNLSFHNFLVLLQLWPCQLNA